MQGNYQKFEINMNMENEDYRLWKKGADEVICILETYKEKRSVFFSVRNLLPSSHIKREFQKTYHVLLIGANEEGVLHREFGTFYVDQRGEGSFFQKFTGPELSCYTHCLLVASSEGSGELDVVYRGATPFFVEPERVSPWENLLGQCDAQHLLVPFSADIDETKAEWYKISAEEVLPTLLEDCRTMIEKYRHYIIGRKEEKLFVGVPGRFLQMEQPCREEGAFLLWQPLRGGESFFDEKETMTERQMEEIFGYWIAEVDVQKECLHAI